MLVVILVSICSSMEFLKKVKSDVSPGDEGTVSEDRLFCFPKNTATLQKLGRLTLSQCIVLSQETFSSYHVSHRVPDPATELVTPVNARYSLWPGLKLAHRLKSRIARISHPLATSRLLTSELYRVLMLARRTSKRSSMWSLLAVPCCTGANTKHQGLVALASALSEAIEER